MKATFVWEGMIFKRLRSRLFCRCLPRLLIKQNRHLRVHIKGVKVLRRAYRLEIRIRDQEQLKRALQIS